jgi:hypothetical protein
MVFDRFAVSVKGGSLFRCRRFRVPVFSACSFGT